jgi:hypothetical protein
VRDEGRAEMLHQAFEREFLSLREDDPASDNGMFCEHGLCPAYAHGTMPSVSTRVRKRPGVWRVTRRAKISCT